jgi:hypothetical protein
VANTELDGIERGTVEDRHRGLLGLARLWGVFVTCLLSVICLFVLYGLVQSSAHSL